MKVFNKFIVSAMILLSTAVFAVAQDEAIEPQTAKIDAAKEEKTNADRDVDATRIIVKNADSTAVYLTRVGVQNSDVVPLTLNEAIRKTLENNNNIEVARDDVRFQETQLRSLRGAYDYTLALTPQFTRNGSTGSNAANNFRVDVGVNKLFERGGGSLSTFFNNNTNGANSSTLQNNNNNTIGTNSTFTSSSGSRTFFSNLGVTYNQPLFRNFKIDNTRRQIKIQRKRLQQSDADFRRQTIEVISQVQNAYWDLVFALRNQQNQLANVNLARENLRQVEAKIEAGSAAPLARAEVSTELANREGELLLATQQVSTTENTLKTLLLRDAAAPEWSQSYVPTDKPAYNDEPINIEDAIKDAFDNRPELRRLRLQREVNAIDVSYFKNQVKPRVDLVSSFSLGGFSLNGSNQAAATANFFTRAQDLIFIDRINSLIAKTQTIAPPLTPIDVNSQFTVPATNSPLFGGFGRSFLNLFRGDSPSYSIGITFEIPFRNTTAKANLAGARIQQQQTDAQTRQQEQTVVAEVRNAVQAVETARQRVLIARRARENAEIQLEGERKLFDVGRSTTFLLFQRENSLTNARNAEIRAETDYNKALSDLQRATSTTFRTNNIEVESPMEK